MKFTCTIDMDNAAFEDVNTLPDMLENIINTLDHVLTSPKHTVKSQTILDPNGNDVGRWKVTDD